MRTPEATEFPMQAALIPGGYAPPLLVPTTTDAMDAMFATLRLSFHAGLTRPLAARRNQLQQLRLLLTDGLRTLQNALLADLHLHPNEVFLTQVAACLSTIQDHLDHLASWVAPHRVSTNFFNMPGSSYVCKDPLGICCLVGTWRSPIASMLLPLVACLAAGNCALLRLPLDGTTNHTNAALAFLVDKYMDPSIVRFVSGGHATTSVLLTHAIDLVLCDGVEVLEQRMIAKGAAETLTPVVLGRGGKSPAIVHSDAHLATTAPRLVWGAFLHAGQCLSRPDYILVDATIGPKFVAALRDAIVDAFGAVPEASGFFGRLVNDAQFDRLDRLFEADRPFLVHGGACDRAERFYAPSVFDFADDTRAFETSACMQEVGPIVGPLLLVAYYNDLDQVLARLRAYPTPRALYLFTQSRHVKQLVVANAVAGAMCVNDTVVQETSRHLHRFAAMFSQTKCVLYKSSYFDVVQRYPPYTPTRQRLLRASLRPVPRMTWIVLWISVAVVVLVVALVLGLVL
ncbi:hypothetical protein SDRG_06420 [Saprolegnia diclina VS20]|uniref:Aldehyde dehydrogenase domain-containing protein n=1 Tax=Saprolegnia diclina (strain VS20) TaxID=1156394 RepID=T0QQX7_SAPDV|nr:hypothetical protein SDRG_06420 [Saprolegnia diclina VS20]EQC36315.1 hypothetical protein SDRG_06420 [Saprolegnia diclina VS20]|eukprot:XP_008610421.1 hypothetical protein SDRG_06420 [Saprolegnia diclina VS20]